jgi:hypothetical protein
MYSDPHDARFTAYRSARHLTYYQNRPPYYQKSKYIIKTDPFIIKNRNILSNPQNQPPRNIFSQTPPQTEKPANQPASFPIKPMKLDE